MTDIPTTAQKATRIVITLPLPTADSLLVCRPHVPEDPRPIIRKPKKPKRPATYRPEADLIETEYDEEQEPTDADLSDLSESQRARLRNQTLDRIRKQNSRKTQTTNSVKRVGKFRVWHALAACVGDGAQSFSLTGDNFYFDSVTCELRRRSDRQSPGEYDQITLRGRDLDIFLILALRRGEVCPWDVFREVGIEKYASLCVAVSNLRRLIDLGFSRKLVHTINGVGFRLNVSKEDTSGKVDA